MNNNQGQLVKYFAQINLPAADSHKGQNGKLLVIGGSKLFHSSIFWAADVASRIVDMVHFTSPANENNQLVRRQIKQGFWTGIVVDWADVEEYLTEDDVVLIGPGMERSAETKKIIDQLLSKFPDHKWVVDGGALQMVDPKLLSNQMIITPHHHELQMIMTNCGFQSNQQTLDQLQNQQVTVLLKGVVDQVYASGEMIEVSGGNQGMTKGGTGDVLAGLVAALYCQNSALVASVVGSYVNKKAGEALWQTVGPYFNSSDLVTQVPKTLWEVMLRSR